jgi:hypothetical protein
MAYGTDGFLGISKQSSWGTNTSSFHFIPFVSESIVTDKAVLMQETILDRYDEPNPVEG